MHDMRRRGVSAWIACKVKGWTTTLAFDGFILEPVPLHRGIDQGFPLLDILFQFYNTDLIDGYNLKKGEKVVAFVDDALMLACQHQAGGQDGVSIWWVGVVMHAPL